MSDGSGLPEGFPQASKDSTQYVDGTDVKWVALGGLLAKASFLAATSGPVLVLEVYTNLHVWAIRSAGGAVAAVIRAVLGGAAATQTEAWTVAASQLVAYGPVAPWIAAVEVVVVLTLAYAIWNRRPYA